MDRRRFLTLLGLAPVAASTKAYSFLGGILRPRKIGFEPSPEHYARYIEAMANPPLVYDFTSGTVYKWFDSCWVRIDVGNLHGIDSR
jgi:hypothetical protein